MWVWVWGVAYNCVTGPDMLIAVLAKARNVGRGHLQTWVAATRRANSQVSRCGARGGGARRSRLAALLLCQQRSLAGEASPDRRRGVLSSPVPTRLCSHGPASENSVESSGAGLAGSAAPAAESGARPRRGTQTRLRV